MAEKIFKKTKNKKLRKGKRKPSQGSLRRFSFLETVKYFAASQPCAEVASRVASTAFYTV
ncbi:hypothetical protein [Microbulbifer sp. VAAF005]|uniref:hypothetical protein n=1 Tax=Microbulbifer sp. VAAF005 TaxID=3034230 RepID=UPI0024AD13F5|nr:hypothetical protein [Microbulbifer sp. VAAF005]WHI48137.1 hypothetical protein P0078_07095 [Microbulbifer sp. VAAF005]